YILFSSLLYISIVFLIEDSNMTIKQPIQKKILKAVETATDFLHKSKSQGLPSRFSVILIGKTRVTLDTVIAVFQQGATAEETVYRYPSLNLADVYATIAFYLNHESEVEAYLQQRRQQSQEIRVMNQAKFDPQGDRDRLLARRTPQEPC
ncbi:MAG: DUF433 domain-containing protein, partial [Microcoleus sp.]|uniref:DUF433 domain-containing protein n=1 Tax=Microcoleus sp. TaxID=44472 RepID=UPI003C75E8F1